MKKLFLIIVMVLLVSGCEEKNIEVKNNTNNDDMMVEIDGEKFRLRSSNSLKDMHFKENYVDFYTDSYGNMKKMSYAKNGEYIFEVRIIYEEERSFDEVKSLVKYSETQKKIGNMTYSYYDYKTDNKDNVHLYICSYKDVTYSVMFIFRSDITDLENKFMNSISFE